MRLLLTGLLIINLCSGDSATSSSTNTASTNTPSTNTASTNTPSTNTASTNTPSTNTASTNTPSTNTASTNTPSTNTASTNTPSTNTPSTNTPSTNTVSTNTSSPPTSPSPTPKHTLTHASKAASTTPPTEKSEMVVNSTKELKYGTPVEIPVDVHPGSSYSFNITNEEDHKPTGEIQVKVTMCNASKEAAKPVEPSKNEIPATKIHDLIIYFNCSHKSRVKRSTGNGEYKMNLFITGTNKTSATKNISIVGISTNTEVPGTTTTHTTAKRSWNTSPSATHATTVSMTPMTPATSLGTGWIIGIVSITLFGVTLIVAISVFVYFYLKRRRGSINKDREDLSKRQSFVNEVLTRTLPLRKTENGYETPQTSSMIITLSHDPPIILNNPQIIPYSDFPIFHHNSPISHHPYIPQQLTKTSMDQEDSEGYIEITK